MENEVLIAVGCVAVVLLICYITALVLTKKGRMVISSGTGDKCLLIISPILAVVSCCFMEKNQDVCLILLSISGFLLLGSLIHAVRNNWGHFGFVLLSLLAKIAIFVFTFLAILVLVFFLICWLVISCISDSETSGPSDFLLHYNHALGDYEVYRIKS